MTKEERLEIAKRLRQETGCGMMAATICFDNLIYQLRHQPATCMDKGWYLVMHWEEPKKSEPIWHKKDAAEIFDSAKFGDKFITRSGKTALFLRCVSNSEWDLVDLYVKDWGIITVTKCSGTAIGGVPGFCKDEHDIVGIVK